MEQNIKEQLIKSVNSIKNKVKQIKDEEQSNDLKINNFFKPVTIPLQILADKKNSQFEYNMEKKAETVDKNSLTLKDFADANDSYNSKISENYTEEENNIKNLMETSLSKNELADLYDNMNIPFGVRENDKKFFIGNSRVKLSVIGDDENKIYIITVNNKPYELTPGLIEVLLRKNPDLKLVTEGDKFVYKNILLETNVHKRDYDPHGQIKGDKSLKYRDIIKPLFYDAMTKSGGSLPVLKAYKKNTDLVYWDDPNELVERLKLLVASRNAGNCNHDNEILSIIEELKEAGIIKQ